MTYIKDGSDFDYHSKASKKNLYSWGWLGNFVPSNVWPKGYSFAQFMKGLSKLPNTLRGRRCRGSHNCELCGERLVNGSLVAIHKGITYQCPADVSHYLLKHNYCPPKEVIEVITKQLPKQPIDSKSSWKPKRWRKQ